MLKLIKYELEAIKTEFNGIMIGMFSIALLGPILLKSNSSIFFVIVFLSGLAILVALAVITFLVFLKIFNKNLFSELGYLKLTVPVSTTKLLISKILTAIIIEIAIFMLTVLAIFIFISLTSFLFLDGFQIISYLRDLIFKTDLYKALFKLIVYGLPPTLLTALVSINVLLLVSSFVNTSFVSKNKLIVAVIMYILISGAISALYNGLFPKEIFMMHTPHMTKQIPFLNPIQFGTWIVENFDGTINHLEYGLTQGYYLAFSVLLFLTSNYLVERKLEI